jgi:O-antigen/teichoic acid export membrane protein
VAEPFAPESLVEPPAAGLGVRAGRGMAWGQLAKVLEAVLTLAVAVAAVRALNPNAFGLYSLLTYLAGSASVLIPIVMVESVGAVLPRFRDARERVSLIALVAGLRIVVIVAVVLFLLPGWTFARDLFGLDAISYRVFVVGAVYWVAQDLLNSIAAFFLAELDMRPVAVWKPAGQIVTLTAIIVIAATEDRWSSSVGEVLAAVAAGYLVSVVGLAWQLRRYGALRLPDRENARALLAFTRTTWLIGVLTFALSTPFDVLLIGAITHNPQQAAFYVVAVGVVVRAQLMLISGWASLMIPASGEALLHGGLQGLARAWRLFSQLWLMVALPINALLLAVARPLTEALFGEEYGRAGDLLVWVAAFNIGTALLLGPTSIAALWALDRQAVLVRVRAATAALNVVLAVVLIHEYEALGAVIATGIAALGTAGAELMLARRYLSAEAPWRFAAQIAVASAVGAAPGFVFRPESGMGVAAVLAVGTLLFVGALVVLRPLRADELAVLGRISPRLASSPLRLFARP